MVSVTDNKFTWVIKDFSSLQAEKIYSDGFVIGGCKWRLIAYPKGNNTDYLSLFLGVADYESLPLGWRRHAKFSLKVVNQLSEKSSIKQASTLSWFDQKAPTLGFQKLLPLTKLHDKDVGFLFFFERKDVGFLVNDEVKIVAEVDVREVIGNFDVSETTQPMKRLKLLNDDLQKETIDVNGFQVLPSQVESVRCIFERHPDFASKMRSNNGLLKSTYMNVLLGLLETLCQFPEDLSDDDLEEASAAVSYVTNVGFKMDWLETKLEEVKEKKNKVNTAKAQLQHMEEELEKLNKKCLDLKALVVKENENVSAANVPFSFDDVV